MRRLLFALAMIALLAAVTAGPAVAKPAGKLDCKNGGWTDWVRADGSAFADQGTCVSYVANGGTLMPPGPVATFQSTCEGLDGGYHLWIFTQGVSAGPACTWSDTTEAAVNAAAAALEGYCVAPSIRVTYIDPEPNEWGRRFGLVGCQSGEG